METKYISINTYHIGKYFGSIPQVLLNGALYAKKKIKTFGRIILLHIKVVWAHVNQRLTGY
jgi:hypothetical protein